MNENEKALGFSSQAFDTTVEADPHEAHGHQHASADVIPLQRDTTPRLVKDLVCGMTVDAETTPHHAEYEGELYYFCSASCRTKFVADPEHYLGSEAKAAEPMAPELMPKGTIYTCPMHPEVRQVGPGSCPICGMALEPVAVTAEAPPNPELIDMTRRFWIGLVLTLPVAALQMGGHFTEVSGWIDSLSNFVQLQLAGHLTEISAWIAPSLSNFVQLAFATPVVLWAGWPFFVRGWRSFVARKLNMFSLIAVGTGVAWVYSVVATLAPELFPSAFRGHDGAVAVYFEAAAGITVLVLLGQVLELRARERTSGAIRALLDLTPKIARRIAQDGSETEIPLDRVMVGDRLRVRPGEKLRWMGQ